MYSNIRTNTYYGECPIISPQYNEVVVSINHYFNAGQIQWIVCYGTPSSSSMHANTYANNESNLQTRINELQAQLNYAHEDMKVYERESRMLNRFIDKAGLRDDWERSLKEEEVKKEMLKQMDEAPCVAPPTEVKDMILGC
jgi:hypothetical protein